MDWEELTSTEFAEARKAAAGVCLAPMGVIEKHGEHLPLGADYFNVREIVRRAAKREPAVVFPPFFFGQCHESKNAPGAIALGRDTLLALIDNVCSEIARNGFTKIVLINGHGGNEEFLSFYSFTHMDRPRPYALYVVKLRDYVCHGDPRWQEMKEAEAIDWHAGESETSRTMYLHPDKVRTDRTPTGPGERTGRLDHLPDHITGVWWPAEFPGQYAGDAPKASVEKGQYLVETGIERLADLIKRIKADEETPRAIDEFFRQAGQGESGDRLP